MKNIFFVFISLFSAQIYTQCLNTSPFGTIVAPTSGTSTISTCSYQEEYSTINSVQAATFYQCSISDGSYITIRQGTPAGPVIASGLSPLNWTSTVSGTYFAHWNTNANCGTASNCLTTTITYISPAFPCSGTPAPGNTVCSAGDTVCPNVNFNLGIQNQMLGSGITYQWFTSTDGVNYIPLVGDTNAVYTTSLSSPAYFYCSETCSGNSTNSNPIFLSIAPYNECYCTPIYFTGTELGDLISNVQIENTTLSNNTGFVSGGPSYTFFTGQSNYTATLTPSNSYTLNVSTGEYGDQGFAAWIDYNDDGSFDTTERIGFTNGTVGSGFTTGQINDSSSFVISLACNPPAGNHRLRIRCAYASDGILIDPCDEYGFGETEDYEITIAPAPICPSAGIMIDYTATETSATVNWQLGCSSSNIYNLEFGPAGFTPGTGTLLTNQTVNVSNGIASFTFNGLIGTTTYDFYYQAICGANSSSWSAANQFTTACSLINGLGWCEGFDNTSSTEQCWTVLNENNDFSSWNTDTEFNQLDGNNCASIVTDFNFGANDDWLISPQLSLTGTEIFNFSYKVLSEIEPNDLKVKISTTGNNPADFTQTLISLDSIINIDYQDTSVNLSSFAGNVYIAFHIPQGGLDGYVLYLDQICIQECVPANIADDSIEVCQTADSLDLNTVVNIGQSYGDWSFNELPSNLDGSILNLNGLTTGVYEAIYLVNNACQSTAASAFIHFYEVSNAGLDSSVILCKGEPFDLFNALGGDYQTAGTWYDPNNQALNNSNILTGNFPGQFNYDYIVANGVCPNDTSNALIIVDNCIWSGIDELSSNLFSVFPNPTNEAIQLKVNEIGIKYNLQITDAQGRLVYVHPKLLESNAIVEVELKHLNPGVYYVDLFNDNRKQFVKIIKQ